MFRLWLEAQQIIQTTKTYQNPEDLTQRAIMKTSGSKVASLRAEGDWWNDLENLLTQTIGPKTRPVNHPIFQRLGYGPETKAIEQILKNNGLVLQSKITKIA